MCPACGQSRVLWFDGRRRTGFARPGQLSVSLTAEARGGDHATPWRPLRRRSCRRPRPASSSS